MKVAFLLGSMNRGGIETLHLDIIHMAEFAKFDILVLFRKDGDLRNAFEVSKVPVIHIAYEHKWRIWNYIKNIRRFVKFEQIDIIHTSQRLDTIIAWIAALRFNTKVVQTIHDFDFNYSKIDRLMISLSLKISEWNIFVSEYQKMYYCTKYELWAKNNISVVYNGIDFNKFKLTNIHSIREQYQIRSHITLMGTVGNFNIGRDHMTICRFLVLLLKHGFDFRFLFIGKKDINNPQYFNDCLTYCVNNGLSEKVIFLGSYSDVPGLLSQLDLYVYSSEHDTFGIAVIEAIASGIPVFVNDWEVMKEITENGERAIIYRSKDENDLFEKYLKYCSQSDYFHSIIKQNAEWARIKFNIQQHLVQLQQVYNEVGQDNIVLDFESNN